MNLKRPFWRGIRKAVLGTALALGVMSLGWGCSDAGNADQIPGDEKSIPVRTMKLEPRVFNEYLQVTGTVKARNLIDVVAEEGGILLTIRKDKGAYVRAGDTLAVLDNPVLEASFREAEAALKQAELNYRSSEVMFAKKAISENDYLAARYALDRARARYQLARARYEKLFLKAPIPGFVNERYVDRGAYVPPFSPVFQIIDQGSVKIRAGVAERFIGDIHVGTPVEIRFDALPDLVLQGEVSFVSRAVDPVARTFTIEIVLPNPDGRLAPEMVANLKILRKQYRDHLVVPLDAIVENEQGSFVFVVNDRRAHRVPVDILAIYADSVVVEGLSPGGELIVVGQHEVSDGDLVEVIASTDS